MILLVSKIKNKHLYQLYTIIFRMRKVLSILTLITVALLCACLVTLGITTDKVNVGVTPFEMEKIAKIPHVGFNLPTVETIDRFMSYETENPISPSRGSVYYDDHKETYYSQNVLPGEALDIPGRHVAFDGTIRDKDGYICLAADYAFKDYGEVVPTSLGWGKVYDTGCAYGTIDLYVDW